MDHILLFADTVGVLASMPRMSPGICLAASHSLQWVTLQHHVCCKLNLRSRCHRQHWHNA